MIPQASGFFMACTLRKESITFFSIVCVDLNVIAAYKTEMRHEKRDPAA